jgi:rSAM/selenodomain-associated transferase 1
MASNRCVIMLVKNPAKTTVKSRLAASLDGQTASSLYKCFVSDLLETHRQAEWPLIILFYPPDAREDMESWLGSGYTLIPQRGADLGERMKNAFEGAFAQGFHGALLIGSDSPDLTNQVFDEAFTSLTNHDAVIGPSLDGGYYLIGFKGDTFLPRAFENIAWSTPEVFEQTMSIFKERGYRVHELPWRRDIDTRDDLKTIFSENMDTPFAESTTMEYLRRMKGDIL